jgi:hypothetical protein
MYIYIHACTLEGNTPTVFMIWLWAWVIAIDLQENTVYNSKIDIIPDYIHTCIYISKNPVSVT